MSDRNAWHRQNDAYLAAALAWLRLKLALMATGRGSPAPAAASQAGGGTNSPRDGSRWNFMRRILPAEAAASPETPSSPSAPEGADAQALADAARALAAASSGSPAPALPLLCEQLGLSAFERDTLLLCAAMELDTRTATLCARAHDDPSRPYPSLALAMALFDEPAWDVLSHERPLRRWRLIEFPQPASQPLMLSALRADERIVSFIKGLNELDERLAALVEPLPSTTLADLPPSQRAVAETVLASIDGSSGASIVVQLSGRDGVSKQQVATAVAALRGLRLVRLSADGVPSQAAELEASARLWHREARLLDLALYVDAQEDEPTAGSDPSRVTRFLARTGGLVFVDSHEGFPRLRAASVRAEVDKPLPAEQRAAWQAALGEVTGELPGRLAGQFNLNHRDITAIGLEARRIADSSELEDRLWRSCLERTRPALERLAEKIDAKATWKLMVLPDNEVQLLHEIAAQVRARTQVYDEWGFRARMNRGLGITALFAGDSGTGKTMAAEVLANELRLDLYRIDLSAVVSKYIGETEKNLRQVFDAAEDGGAILLFDEADALFGKRSEVKDSHDRYANIEINYLLQRMEGYRGLAILATNMKSALDQAFMRRLRFVVNFPFPGPAERRRIWETVFPGGVPLGRLDYDRLARPSLTGGNIHSIALSAAFRAARDNARVTMKGVLDASRAELRKLDRPVHEADFRWDESMEVGR